MMTISTYHLTNPHSGESQVRSIKLTGESQRCLHGFTVTDGVLTDHYTMIPKDWITEESHERGKR